MTNVLVFLETSSAGKINHTAKSLLAAAAHLGNPVAVTATNHALSDSEIAEIGELGATALFSYTSQDVATKLVTPQVDAIVSAVAAFSPVRAVLAPHSLLGKEAAARAAIRLNTGILTDVVELHSHETEIVATHSVFGGEFLVKAAIPTSVPIITIRAGAIDGEAPAAIPSVIQHSETSSVAAATIVAENPATADIGRPDLATARIVVSGGRGMGSEENFRLVGQLADELGAAVGASRAAVDSGYAAQSLQVGQTGTTVSPQLYIALGISGAIQHRAGMQTSGVIIAVNRDDEAPIFEIADVGVVGDVLEVVPQVVEALQRRTKSV